MALKGRLHGSSLNALAPAMYQPDLLEPGGCRSRDVFVDD